MSEKRTARKIRKVAPEGDLVKFNAEREAEVQSVSRASRRGTFSTWPMSKARSRSREMGHGAGTARKSRTLSIRELRRIGVESPTVRPCIDQIINEVAFLPWRVFPRRKEGIDYKAAKEHASEVTEFLKNPNVNHDSLSHILQRTVRDLLEIDRCVIQKVFSTGGKLSELWSRDASDYTVDADTFGVINGYTQSKEGEDKKDAIKFTPKEIGHLVLHPATYSHYGYPLIETICNQAASIMVAYSDISRMWVEDEIPPGVLVLGKIGEEALARAKASFTKTRGIRNRFKLRVIDNIEGGSRGAAWVPFGRSNRDQQTAELVTKIEKVIYRNFGLSPVDMGETTQVNRASSETQRKATGSRMIAPLAQLMAFFINDRVVSEFKYEDVVFGFILDPRQVMVEKVNSLIALQRIGDMSRNEVRQEIGYEPVEGGDNYTVLLGNEVVPFDEEGVPQYRNRTPLPGSPRGLPPGRMPAGLLPPPGAQERREDEEARREEAEAALRDGAIDLATYYDWQNPYALEDAEYGSG